MLLDELLSPTPAHVHQRFLALPASLSPHTGYCTDPVTGKLYISEGPGTVCADGTVPTSKQNSVTW
jgi:hypothetical protein